MIAEHQPKSFPRDRVIVGISSIEDGNMKNGDELTHSEVMENRRRVLGSVGLEIGKGHLVKVTYDTDDYCRYSVASKKTQSLTLPSAYVTPAADALMHDKPNEALILPLADCCGVVLYDERQHKFMVSHIGRHSAIQKGAQRSVDALVQQYGSERSDILAYLTPAAGKGNYPIFDLDGRGLHEVITEQLRAAGLQDGKIEVAQVDTTLDDRYFSHSEFLKGNRPMNGRQILFAATLPLDSSSVTLE
jgi:copper oxidase (laccase) domain-containing protein